MCARGAVRMRCAEVPALIRAMYREARMWGLLAAHISSTLGLAHPTLPTLRRSRHCHHSRTTQL